MKKIAGLLLVFLLILGGCKSDAPITYEGTFDEYVNSLYADIMGTTDIGINLSFNDPESFGIVPEPYVLGFSTKEDYAESDTELNNMIRTLESFSDSGLTEQQIVDRDALIDYLSSLVGSSKFYEYEEGDALSSSRSYIMSLPSYLDMYVFNHERDIEYYFNFIETLEGYFKQYTDLEKTRQTNNMGLSQKELDSIATAADSTADAAAQDDYFLNTTFNEKMESVTFIDQAKKDEYIEKNKALMQTSFSKAYASLSQSIKEISGGELRGLASKENGKAYYEYLLKKNTGSSYTVKELSKLLESRKRELLYRIMAYFQTAEDLDPNIETMIQTGSIFDNFHHDAYTLLNDMYTKMTGDFPEITVPVYEVKMVDESLKESSSPAFYFTPKVDATDSNTQYIYVNGVFDNRSYTTYVHEGIPGHMYQFNYFKQSGENQIRSLLSSSANAEGWANYTENYATKYVLGEELGAFYADYMEFLNILYVDLDIGINYEGWTQEETLQFMIDEGWYSSGATVSDVEGLYMAFVENPCIYPMYYVSSMYIRILGERAEEAWGNDYSDYIFHEKLLNLGSVSFDMIESYLDLKIIK